LSKRSTDPHLLKTELSHSCDSPYLIPSNFLLLHKGENCIRIQDVRDTKKNVKTELDAVSLDDFGGCTVQRLEIHIVKEDDFYGK
jgi:hypothetical protein